MGRARVGRERLAGAGLCSPLLFAALTGRSGHGLALDVASSTTIRCLPARPLRANCAVRRHGSAHILHGPDPRPRPGPAAGRPSGHVGGVRVRLRVGQPRWRLASPPSSEALLTRTPEAATLLPMWTRLRIGRRWPMPLTFHHEPLKRWPPRRHPPRNRLPRWRGLRASRPRTRTSGTRQQARPPPGWPRCASSARTSCMARDALQEATRVA